MKPVAYIPSLRSVFGPDPGRIWVSIDYAQLEPRIFATLARDKGMLEAFDNGEDFHEYTQRLVIDVLYPEKAEWERRRLAKAVNFKVMYGGINSSDPEVAKKFPAARRFMDEVIAIVNEQGFVETADGYPLYPQAGEPYKGADYRIQGTAGRIIKKAMRQLGEENIVDWKSVILVVQIHDELVFDIDVTQRSRNDVVRLVRRIMDVMEAAGQSMQIHTPVEAKIHLKNWADGISLREYQKGRK